ncbi:MAG: hypothetical protein I3275_00445 [Candidatus Moeniiplasma glomeromycotorum]|nr:hypothetical protein [Candidatus Moeniiplasma glomeromycotorum]
MTKFDIKNETDLKENERNGDLNENKYIMKSKKTSSKKLLTCPWCKKGFYDCLVVDDEKGAGHHFKCLEEKKEKETLPKDESKGETQSKYKRP